MTRRVVAVAVVLSCTACALVPGAPTRAPACGGFATGHVSWTGMLWHGYVETVADDRPTLVLLFACVDAATDRPRNARDAARFAVRITDAASLPPLRHADNQRPLRVSGRTVGGDSVRGLPRGAAPFLTDAAIAAIDSLGAPPESRPTPALFVLDGHPVRPGRFDQRLLAWLTIESIEIVRGARATDRFGLDAGYGAVVLKTAPGAGRD